MDAGLERRRRALTMLSSLGAALAGAGAGIYLAADLVRAAPMIFASGLAAHLFGMVGVRRLLRTSQYTPAAWEQFGYWSCWILIAAALGYGVFALT